MPLEVSKQSLVRRSLAHTVKKFPPPFCPSQVSQSLSRSTSGGRAGIYQEQEELWREYQRSLQHQALILEQERSAASLDTPVLAARKSAGFAQNAASNFNLRNARGTTANEGSRQNLSSLNRPASDPPPPPATTSEHGSQGTGGRVAGWLRLHHVFEHQKLEQYEAIVAHREQAREQLSQLAAGSLAGGVPSVCL